jgi:hypothetical protein
MVVTRSEVQRTKESKVATEKKNNTIFFDIFSTFLESAETQVDIEHKIMTNSFDFFKETMIFYGEDVQKVKTITTEEFFGHIVTFIRDFDEAVQKLKTSKKLTKKPSKRNKVNAIKK